MRDLGRILRGWEALASRGETAVIATVVQVEGSAYRRPGARMVIPVRGETIGAVSGGCLESDLVERADEVRRGDRPATVVYDMRSPDDVVWGLGLGCDGEIRVLIERLDPSHPPAWTAFLADVRDGREPVALATVFAVEGTGVAVGDRVGVAADGALAFSDPADDRVGRWIHRLAAEALRAGRGAVARAEVGDANARLLIEVVEPPPRLLVCGAGYDARPLVDAAAALGWRVRVVDHRTAYAVPARFPAAESVRCVDPRAETIPADALAADRRTAVVIMTHHFAVDVELLLRLVASGPAYVGLLGPARRRHLLLDELRARGVTPSPTWLARLYGPAGLDIGSETPEEIALSIVAEIRTVLSRRSGGSLREREGPLHGGPAS